MDSIEPDSQKLAPSRNAREVARGLARAFLHDSGDVATLQQQAISALGRNWPWLPLLVRKLADHFSLPLRPADFDRIVAWLLSQAALTEAFESSGESPQLYRYFSFHPQMITAPSPLAALNLPTIHTVGDLAGWLGLSLDELDWLADIGGWRGKSEAEARRHYRYLWKPKARGGLRLI